MYSIIKNTAYILHKKPKDVNIREKCTSKTIPFYFYVKIKCMKLKANLSKTIADSYIVLLSIFIATFFIINEYFDLELGPEIILPITVFLTLISIILQRKINIFDYILLPVIIFDGFFHLTSPLERLVENSPDWVIAFNLYQGNGMPVIGHQIIGAFLLLTSGCFIYLLISKKKNWTYFIYKYAIVTITLTIISFSYLIKLLE
ncbi:MAG: hypothetical protein KAR54_02295 [Candidatus Pacebacteria bacterium]|nr:hypothetical protein [Candidatus Paceibacterota bacterium]